MNNRRYSVQVVYYITTEISVSAADPESAMELALEANPGFSVAHNGISGPYEAEEDPARCLVRDEETGEEWDLRV